MPELSDNKTSWKLPLKVEVKELSPHTIKNLVDTVFGEIWAVQNAVFATEFIHIIKYTLLVEFR